MRIVKMFWRVTATVWLFLGMLVLVGVFAAEAWDCSGYNFRVTASGEIQVENQSTNNEPPQEADVWINDQKVREDLSVPEMEKGTDWIVFGLLPPPEEEWEWRVKGSKDCEDTGEHESRIRPTNTPEPTSTLVPTEVDEPTVTERPYDCHVDGDGICPGEESPTPAIIYYTSTPTLPTPTGTPLPLIPTKTGAACPICCGCSSSPIVVDVSSATPDYSEAILEFKPIVYILIGILGANCS